MRHWLLASFTAAALGVVAAAEPPASEPFIPQRTDSGDQSTWHRLTVGEFPAMGSEHRLRGELVSADYIHRRGQFRDEATGVIIDFSLLPCAALLYHNAEADLRDFPLRSRLTFFLYLDAAGRAVEAAAVEDDLTLLARDQRVYRIAKVSSGDGGAVMLTASRQKPGENVDGQPIEDLKADEQTHVWKGDKQATLKDVAAGDEVLADSLIAADGAARCGEIFIGADAARIAADGQRKTHIAFVKRRGMAGLIEGVTDKQITVTLFGDKREFAALCKDQEIDPLHYEKHAVHAVVANLELRTYNPPVDNENSLIFSCQTVAADRWGSSGVQWTMQPNLMLEGFRKGRVVRLFKDSWQMDDMPFGETLYTERPGAPVEEESANQYSYRTDFAHDELPWYALQPGMFPPSQSQHTVMGELVKLDPQRRAGQLRVDKTGELVDFTLSPFANVLYLGVDAELADLPLGGRYAFFMYRDSHGAFTVAGQVCDNVTPTLDLSSNGRVEAVRPDAGEIDIALQPAPMKDDKDHVVQPPDVGHTLYRMDASTRVWKDEKPAALGDIAVGDWLQANYSGQTQTAVPRCTDLWIGEKTWKHAADERRDKHREFVLAHGMPGWVTAVTDKTVTVSFFGGRRRDFQDIKQGEPYGQGIVVKLADDDLRPADAPAFEMHLKENLPDQYMNGMYGPSGTRWVLEADKLPDGLTIGRAVHVWKPEWASKPPVSK